jgi:hypothetical protein
MSAARIIATESDKPVTSRRLVTSCRISSLSLWRAMYQKIRSGADHHPGSENSASNNVSAHTNHPDRGKPA